METKKGLKAKQLQAIKLLARGESKKYVADTLEISVMTVYRWRRLPAFKSQLQTITTSETGMETTARMLNAAALTAIENLQEILASVYHPVEIRLKAAQIVLRAATPFNAAIEKGLKHRLVDFTHEERWGNGSTFDGAGKLIDKSYSGTPSVVNADGAVEV